MVQLPMFDHIQAQKYIQLCAVGIRLPKDLLKVHNQPAPPIQNDSERVKKADASDPFEVLGLDPLLADVTPDATGIMAEPAWSAVFATQNLLDHLGIGIDNKSEIYEQRLYDVIWRAKLELDLVGHPERVVTFFFQIEISDLHLALVIRNEFRPPAAVLGLAVDF